jgi:hypothetical protein
VPYDSYIMGFKEFIARNSKLDRLSMKVKTGFP